MALALPAFLCFVSGFLLVRLSWSRVTPLASELMMQTSLSVGFGLGVFSVTYFIARVAGITNLLVIDVGIAAFLLVALILFRPKRASTAPTVSIGNPIEPSWLRRSVTITFALTLCTALYATIMRTLAHPHGDGWDAFAIWNLHARFLFLGGSHWRDGFTALLPGSHPDYPLLLPAATAHFWTFLGHDDPRVAAVISLLFTLSTAGLLFTALSILSGQWRAMLGGIALLATPSFIEQGTSQYADVPLSFFFLATIALLRLHDDLARKVLAHNDRNPEEPSRFSSRLLVLAGLAASFAAWTKNEGLLFLCAIVGARLFELCRAEVSVKNWLARIRPLIPFLLGVVPGLLLIAFFKHSIAPPSDLFSSSATTVHKLLQPSRYWAIIQWYVKGFFRFGHWLLVPGTVLLLVLYFLGGKRESVQPQAGIRTSVIALTFTLAGYFAVYLITPHDIYWQLRFSLNRLFLQLWPSAIFLFFLALNAADPVQPPLVSK